MRDESAPGDGTPKTGWERLPIVDPVERLASPDPSGTFVGVDAVLEGTLRVRHDIRIDSEFRGAIESDGVVVIGPTGSLVGDIRAREVVICGAVVGDVFARRQFSLRAEGRLTGDVESACVEIAKYAFFNGRTTMVRPEMVARTGAVEPAASPPDPADASAALPVAPEAATIPAAAS